MMETRGDSRGRIRPLKRLCYIDMPPSSTTSTDTEHAASLGNFYLNFGDVQGTDELIARLEASARRNTDDRTAVQ